MTIDEAWEKVATACDNHGVAFGGPTLGMDELQKRKDQGAQLLVNSSEFQAFSAALVRDIRQFDELK